MCICLPIKQQNVNYSTPLGNGKTVAHYLFGNQKESLFALIVLLILKDLRFSYKPKRNETVHSNTNDYWWTKLGTYTYKINHSKKVFSAFKSL